MIDMGDISNNFSLSEFEVTDYPSMQYRNKIQSDSIKENVKGLVENILQPLRDCLGYPLAINSGYRNAFLNDLVGGVKTSQHCFDTETEILTDNGWKRYDTISECDKAYTYNIDSEEIELKPINEIIRIHHEGKMCSAKNKHIDVMCTDMHNVIVRYDSHKYKRKSNNVISKSGQEYFNSLKTDNDKWHMEMMRDVFGKRRIFMTCGKTSSQNEVYDDFLHFVMAVVADGHFGFDNGGVSYVGFHVKKERKIEYLKRLMRSLGIKYSIRVRQGNEYYFRIQRNVAKAVFDIIGINKDIPYSILGIGSENLRSLVMTYAFFDGHKDDRENSTGITISSVSEHNASVLQAMCVLSGMRCVMSSRDGKRNIIRGKMVKNASRVYNLSICPNTTESKVHEDGYSYVDYKGDVWCIRNDNDTVIIRRNGKVSIQGNCKGEAADICPYRRNKKCTEEEIMDMANTVVRLNLPFDQMGIYPDFVHISHRTDGKNRGMVFYSKNWKGGKFI